MIPHVIYQGDISQANISSFLRVKNLLACLPTNPERSCHVLTRVLHNWLTDWKVEDGTFGYWGWQHSWLRQGEVIIDAYPWCSASAHMVYAKAGHSPWAQLYRVATLTSLGLYVEGIEKEAKETINNHLRSNPLSVSFSRDRQI